MSLDIRKLANTAKVYLSDEEVITYEKELLEALKIIDEGIVSVVPKRADLDPENPMILRKDVEEPSLKRDDFIKNAPTTEAGCVVVPRVIEE